jgi:hypothetical protein
MNNEVNMKNGGRIKESSIRQDMNQNSSIQLDNNTIHELFFSQIKNMTMQSMANANFSNGLLANLNRGCLL